MAPNLTPHKPLLQIVKIDETANWCEEVKELAGRVFGVYVFDARRRVHCCEFVPSHELHLIESQPAWIDGNEPADDDLRCRVYDILTEGNSQCGNGVIYVHCSQVENAPTINSGFLPDGKMGVYKLYDKQEKRDAQDKSDAEYDAKVKEEWENLPNDRETQCVIGAWKEEGEKATAEAVEEILESASGVSF